MTAIDTNADDTDNSTGARPRQLNVTGYGALDAPTLEVAPTTTRAEVDLEASSGGVSLVVDVFSPGDVRTRATAELFPEQARALRDDLDDALDEVDR